VAGEDFKAPRSAPSLGKTRPREGAGWPGRRGGGARRGRAGARAASRSAFSCQSNNV
jgi:hypothetical protein